MSLKISRILHAGYLFETEGRRIVFDPIFENPFSRNCRAFPAAQFDEAAIRDLTLDAVFISHFHDDHCSLESLDLLSRETPIYLYCRHEKLFALIRDLGFRQVCALRIDQSVQIGPMTVIPRRALEDEVDSMFQVRTQDLNVLNVVDAWIDDSTMDLLVKEGSWDLLLWPFQTLRENAMLDPRRAEAAETCLPPEWIEQLKRLRPRYVVPSSCQYIFEEWSWYNKALFPISYRQFQNELNRALPEIEVRRLNPGRSFVLDQQSLCDTRPLPWIHPVGEQDVDYQYQPGAIPTTAEIVGHFSSLSSEEAQRVREFCQIELPRIYHERGAPAGDFFKKSRYWWLVIYKQDGLAENFYYRLNEDTMDLLPVPSSRVEWKSEIPEATLWAAIERGDALNSIYLRVNDHDFPAALEAEIFEAEILEDPLLRCLYGDSVTGYQEAQLRRLMQASLGE